MDTDQGLVDHGLNQGLVVLGAGRRRSGIPGWRPGCSPVTS
jgi:hypothetical protein